MHPKIEEMLRQLAPIIGNSRAIMLRKMYLIKTDPRQKRQVEDRISFIHATHVAPHLEESVILPPPSKGVCAGDIEVGMVDYIGTSMYPFQLRLKDLNRHMAIMGATGGGKTTLAFQLIKKIHNSGTPLLIIDWEQSYRPLVKEIPGIEIYTIGRDTNPLFLNPMQVPEGISQAEYAKSLINLMAEDYLSGAGSDSMILRYMIDLYNSIKQPTFDDLKHKIMHELDTERRKKGRLAGRSGLWKETVERIFWFLSVGAVSKSLCTRKHMPIHRLLDRTVVLELGGIKSPRDRRFIVHLLLNWITLHLEHRGIQSDHLKNVVVLEEFHNICTKQAFDPLVEPLFRTCRKYGMGLIAIDQTPSGIPIPIFANTNVKISFALGTSQDVSAAAKAMNLNEPQYLTMLNTGEAICSVRQSMADPFVVKVPYADYGDFIDDYTLKGMMQDFADDSHVNITPQARGSSFQSPQKADTFPPHTSHSRQSSDPGKVDPLDKCMLTDIINHPFDGVDQRIKRLGLHPSQAKEITDKLTRQCIIKPVTIDRKKLFEFTDFGRNRIQLYGLRIPKSKGRGGVEHAYVVDVVMAHLQGLGFKPKQEVQDIDIVADFTGGKIAIEVETGKSNIHTNIAKILKTQVSGRFIITTQKDTELIIKQMASVTDDISVYHFKDFLKLTPEHITPVIQTV